MLAEESWRNVKKHSNGKGVGKVSVIDGRIIITEINDQEITLHMAAAISKSYENMLEELVCEAAMRESGDYQYSLREVNEILLVQVSAYGIKSNDDLENELSRLFVKLTDVLSVK